jgi:hypothetical protein
MPTGSCSCGASCFSDKATEEDVGKFLGNHGISYEEARDTGALTLAGTKDVYFENDRFDPERILSVLRKYHEDSVAPVTAVCQYDARSFDGAVIMDILKVHPLMVIRGSVIHNPFFIKPEEFLDEKAIFSFVCRSLLSPGRSETYNR